MTWKKLLYATLLLLVIACAASPVQASTTVSKSYTISPGEYSGFQMSCSTADLITVNITVTGQGIDFYILHDIEYDKFIVQLPFSAEVSRYNASRIDLTWQVPITGAYYFIFDNRNGNSTSYVSGTITQDNSASTVLLVIIGLAALVAVLVGFAKRATGKKKSPSLGSKVEEDLGIANEGAVALAPIAGIGGDTHGRAICVGRWFRSTFR